MSVPTIEAKSLSSLTALASNPPAYPRNPTHIRHEPLVLYIARVPGSRDVFLSPMKPREKVVTAEDIQSSLYFIHVEQPEDAQLISSHFREPQYAVQGSRNHEQPPTAAVQRKAVGGGSNSPVRKPVPGTLAPASNYDSRQNVAAGSHSQRPNTLGPDYSPRNSVEASRYSQENVRPTASPRRSTEQPKSPGTALTIIRRDPASSVQWNVARIEDPSVLEVSSSTLHEPSMKRKIGAPLYIEVYNPGYSKFLHSEAMKPELLSRNSDMSTRTHQTRVGPPSQLPDHLAARQPTENENIFRRRLWMEGAQIPNGGFGHRKNSSYDYSTSRPDSRNGYDRQTGRPSMDTRFPTSPSFVSRDDQAYESLRVSESQPSFRGYVFTSPWNGRCEFITGGGGGSLKCRHIIPGLQGAPPVAMQVSELRFNLPSSSKVATPRGEESSKRSSFFHRGRHSRHNSSVSISQEDNVDGVRNSLDRLDLSLGQEFAGGGFGGKQAKLGKIIIEDEGLKMMDLLVAANVGLWWRAYEKASAT